MSLTAREWWALAAAYAERAENLTVRADEQGEATRRELAALERAIGKVREALVTDRSWGSPPTP